MQIITPGAVEVLENCEGEYGLTLITCTPEGKRRLLVKCKRGV